MRFLPSGPMTISSRVMISPSWDGDEAADGLDTGEGPAPDTGTSTGAGITLETPVEALDAGVNETALFSGVLTGVAGDAAGAVAVVATFRVTEVDRFTAVGVVGAAVDVGKAAFFGVTAVTVVDRATGDGDTGVGDAAVEVRITRFVGVAAAGGEADEDREAEDGVGDDDTPATAAAASATAAAAPVAVDFLTSIVFFTIFVFFTAPPLASGTPLTELDIGDVRE